MELELVVVHDSIHWRVGRHTWGVCVCMGDRLEGKNQEQPGLVPPRKSCRCCAENIPVFRVRQVFRVVTDEGSHAAVATTVGV